MHSPHVPADYCRAEHKGSVDNEGPTALLDSLPVDAAAHTSTVHCRLQKSYSGELDRALGPGAGVHVLVAHSHARTRYKLRVTLMPVAAGTPVGAAS
jgi:hypothetical protein